MVSLTMEDIQSAIIKNDIVTVLEIVENGQIPNLQPEYTPEGVTVLHIAAIIGFTDCVEQLVERHKADINAVDSTEWTPLMHAITNGNTDMVRVLLGTGGCNVNTLDVFHQTCLHLEAQSARKSPEVATALVKHGAKIDIKDSEGMTPFLRAVEAHNFSIAKFLYKKGADVAVCNKSGHTALHIASYRQYEDLVAWLIEIGCSVNEFDNRFQTPLMMCLQNRWQHWQQPETVFQITRKLLRAGSKINVQDIQGNTALLLAVSNPATIKRPHVELLLQAGADPNIPNREGLTAIWQAVYDGIHYPDRMKIIQLLIHKNCYLNMSCRGKLLFTSGLDTVYCYEAYMSPLEVALDSGFYEAARLLIVAGCDIKSDLRIDTQTCEIPAELNWLRDLMLNPQSLKHQSRLIIRKILGDKIQSSVKELPLPELLKGYTLLHDVLDVNRV